MNRTSCELWPGAAYMVSIAMMDDSGALHFSFQVTDPLYVFDLSDPFQPKTLGELHIEGYSDYLHPITEDLLLGIGKDAVPDTGATDFNGRGAWYQGLKLALFDVSDPSTPTEIRSMIIGSGPCRPSPGRHPGSGNPAGRPDIS